jgi:oligopeptide transport system ATP-binding protein
MSDKLLEIRDLKKHFPVMKGLVFQKPVGLVKAVDGVSYSIGLGETVGLVGESGCGKTTTMKMILMLEKPTAGSILFRGEDIQDLVGKDFRAYRKGVQAVFQDPYSSLNPRMRVGDIIAEPLVVNEALPKAKVRERDQARSICFRMNSVVASANVSLSRGLCR